MSTAVARERTPTIVGATGMFERVLPLLPLVASYLLLVAYLGWHASGHASPWLFTDEIEYTQLARSLAETGEPTRRGEPYPFEPLIAHVLAPIWATWEDTERVYELTKYLQVFLMASVLFPTYALARLLVPRPYALFAAVASASIPAMAYSRLLITEPLAYPFAGLVFFLIVKGLATRRLVWLVPAGAGVVFADEVRNQFETFVAIFCLSTALLLWLSDWAREHRARLGWGQWPMWAAAALLAAGAGHVFATRHVPLYYLGTTLPDRLHDYAVWTGGAFVIGIGVVPAVIALAALWRPDDLDRPAYRAFTAVFISATAAMILYTTLKATYISTVFASVVSERNLIYLSPLFFVGAAIWLHRPSLSVPVLGAATTLVAYVIYEAQYQLDHFPYSDAPGLAVLAEANRSLALGDAEIRRGLVWIAVGGLVFAATLALAGRQRRRASTAAAAVVAVGVIAWEVVGMNAFGNGVNRLAAQIRGTVPQPPTWVDRAADGESVVYVGQGIADPNPILATEFWNRSLRHIGSVDGSAPGPGPAPVFSPYDTRGFVANDPHVRYVLTDSPAIDVHGRLVEQTGVWRLIDVRGSIRLRSAWTGVYPDGWMGSAASYSVFGETRAGVVDVAVSRVGWNGPNRPGKVTIRIGELVTPTYSTIMNPCRHHDPCLSIHPRIGQILATRTWTANAGKQRLFRIPVAAPFRVEVTVDPTFAPTEFGESDNRQLGAQIAFAFKPAS